MKSTSATTHRAMIAGLLMPGAGQAVQRRYVAAAVWSLMFLVPCGVFFWLAYRAIVGLYRFALNFDTATPPDVVPLSLVVSFLVAMLVYVASLLDVHAFTRRSQR